MRRSPAGQFLNTNLQNGQIIQVFIGTPTASPVSFNGTLTATGYPANSPFVKLRPESLIRIVLNCDMNPGSGNDTIWTGIYVDGVLQENIAHQTTTSDETSTSFTLDGLRWSAGSHTVEVKMYDTQNHSCSLLCNGSCDIAIIEYI